MQVVSGPIGHERVHFEAPPSFQVPEEIQRYIQWFNDTALGGKHEIRKAAVRSAVAHLYFESIHPFEDGNGRIGRALSEKTLSQGLGRLALLSLSRVIEARRKEYYDALKEEQQSNEITSWVSWFINTALEAQIQAEGQIDFTLKKTRLFDRFRDQLNERQLKILRRMLEEGPAGFEDGMSAKRSVYAIRRRLKHALHRLAVAGLGHPEKCKAQRASYRPLASVIRIHRTRPAF